MKLNFKGITLESVELKFDEGGRRFKGYASTFNGNDSYDDTILPGAYAKTIAEHGMPKMFWGHDWDIPIGKWLSAVEDEKGLLVEGEFTPGNSQADAVMAAMKHGTVMVCLLASVLLKATMSAKRMAVESSRTSPNFMKFR